MTPSCLTDDELLRHYDDLFRQHPATAELSERARNRLTLVDDELAMTEDELENAKHELAGLREDRDALAEVLEDFLDDTSAANAKAARKVLDGLR